jgi:hypothetical protein
MAIAIAIIATNEELIKAANEGDMPPLAKMGDGPTYLLMESGRANRVITHVTFMEIKKAGKRVRSTQRKIFMVS